MFKKATSKNKLINKKQQTYLHNTGYLSNQMWYVGANNAAPMI